MLNLTQVITRFRDDCDLTHQFINGTSTSLIDTENGPIPSINKIATDAIAKFEDLLSQMKGVCIHTFSFDSAIIWSIKHTANTNNFVETIINVNGQRVYGNVRIIDNTEFLVEFTEPESGKITVMFYLNT